jgi:hypothetical protein
MVKQIITSDDSGLTQPTAPVWNPLDYLPKEESFGELDPAFFMEVESLIDGVVQQYHVADTNPSVEETYGFEVGDDRVDLSPSVKVLGRELILQEKLFKMKTSWKDTYISDRDWNFCEVTSAIPGGQSSSYDYARKNGSLEQLCFNDVPVLRLIGNVQKGDRSHSSSATGKSSMVARRLMTPRTSNRPVMMLASWIQDGCLNTVKNSDPKYLHGIMGGGGCPPLWDNPANTFLYVKAYKGGSYSRVYGTAINEVRNAVNDLETGRPASVILCKRLREKQEYLHATYASSVLIPKRPEIESFQGPPLPPPLYTAAGTSAFVQATERRLIASKRVLTRTQAEIEISRNGRLIQSILGLLEISELERLDRLQRRARAERYDGAFRASAAVKRLLDRNANGTEVDVLIEEGFLHIGTGVLDITYDAVKWHCAGGRGEIYTLDDVTTSEDIYLRLDVIEEETLKIPGITLETRLSETTYRVRETEARVGLWRVDKTLEEWCDFKIAKLLEFRSMGIIPGKRELLSVVIDDAEWVTDDAPLMAVAVEKSEGKPPQTFFLISSDIKLGRSIANATGNFVAVASPESIINILRGKEWSSNTVLTAEEVEIIRPYYGFDDRVPMWTENTVLMDTGSIAAYAMRYEESANSHGNKTGGIRKVFDMYEEHVDGRRTSHFKTKEVARVQSYSVRLISPNRNELPIRTQMREGSESSDPPSWRRRMSKMVSRMPFGRR